MNSFSPESRKEDKFKKRLHHVIREENLERQRALIENSVAELGVDLLTLAAALAYLSQPNLYPSLKPQTKAAPTSLPARHNLTHCRNVRYRLAVGSQHRVSREEIQAILVDVSGVDRKCIGRIDIRDSYTLVELPDGMPADIFQLLADAEIGARKLNIKRIKPNKFRQIRGQTAEENSL